MAITGFWVDREAPGVSDLIRTVRLVNGTTYSEGDACFISTTDGSAGLLVQASAQNSPVQYVFLSMVSDKSYLRPSTFNDPTVSEYGEVLEVSDGYSSFPIVLATQFALATFDGTACNSNSSTTSVLFTGAGSTDDFTGGQVYINELNQQATVLDDDVSGGVHTLTVAPAFSRAPTTGDTLRVVPWGPGYVGGVQLQPTSNFQQGLDVAVASKTGGPLFIFDVDLSKRIAYVRFQPFLIAK